MLPSESVPRTDDHAAEQDRATELAMPLGNNVVTGAGEINFTHDTDTFVVPVARNERYKISIDNGFFDVYKHRSWIRGEELFEADLGTHEFHIEVRGDRGPYELQIQRQPNDHGSGRNDATRVSLPSTTSGVIAAIDDQDWFRFTPEIGEEYDIIVENEGLTSSEITLYQSSGAQVVGKTTTGNANQLLYRHEPRLNRQSDIWILVEANDRCFPAHVCRITTGEYTLTVRITNGTVIENDLPGDANLDGEFNSADLVQVFTFGEFEDDVVGNSTWQTGDWTRDGEFDASDFVFAYTHGGYRA